MALKGVSHPNLAAWFKQMNENSRACVWLLCWLYGRLWGAPWLCLLDPKTQSDGPRIRFSISISSLTCLKTWLTLETLCCRHPDLELWLHFRSIVLNDERYGPSVPVGERSELSSLRSVDSRPKAPRELLGTCEGPSSVTWLGPSCHKQ